MIKGFFTGPQKRPIVAVRLEFPFYNKALGVQFLIDTGAGRTTLSSVDALRMERLLGISVTELPEVRASEGIAATRVKTYGIQAVISMDREGNAAPEYQKAVTLSVFDPRPFSLAPNLLGRNIINEFVVLINPAAETILFLE